MEKKYLIVIGVVEVILAAVLLFYIVRQMRIPEEGE